MKTKQQPVIANQLSVFGQLPASHDITTEPVPQHLSLRPGLVWIVITKTQGDERIRYQLPVQWTRTTQTTLIHEIRGVVWQLGDDGIPRHLEEIIGICERICKAQHRGI